jgi:hypothetical protein
MNTISPKFVRMSAMDNKLDFVQYLRQWASVNPDDQVIKDLHKAADEIERLRAEVLELRRAYGKAVDYIGRIGDD